jgi:hypothetical protein
LSGRGYERVGGAVKLCGGQLAGRLLGLVARLEQPQRVNVDAAGDALQALEGQVALAALDAATATGCGSAAMV